MNLADPELELIDPTPDVCSLFVHFDKLFFSTKLANRAVVRWSKRMYSCAGVCSYEGRGGLCDIALSEPLLKLRPRKDLVETLLHEMIHAFLFVTNRDQDRDGHGPNFKAHMYRINKAAGINITIFHSFTDEVALYQTHWWRCDGPCQNRGPHFGIVRRSMNRAPGPSDHWWNFHLRMCGGNFIKVKEPQKQQKTNGKKKTTVTNVASKSDITAYITKTTSNGNNPKITVLKDFTTTKTNNPSSSVSSKNGVVFNPTSLKPPSQPIPVFTGSGHTLTNGICRPKTEDIKAAVRSIWAAKQIPTMANKDPVKKMETSTFKKPAIKVSNSNPNKHKAEPTLQSPPTKIKKIDDYFKATSILKDLYGNDYNLTQPNNSTKLVAVNVKEELVDCPVCHAKFSNEEINRHLDECLNKEIIERLSKDSIESVPKISQPDKIDSEITKPKVEIGVIASNNNVIDLTDLNKNNSKIITSRRKRKTESQTSLQSADIDKLTLLAKETNEKQARKSTETNISNNANKLPEKRRNTVSYITIERGDCMPSKIKEEREDSEFTIDPVAGPSTEEVFGQNCPCCGEKFNKPVEEHLDECLVFFGNNTTIPDEGASTSYVNNTTVLIKDDDDDDLIDESLTLNATGTKTPCPCCMKMVEHVDMNDHLDMCLQ